MLEWGPASPHAASFDIDWEHAALPRPRRRAAADPRLVLWRGAGKGRDRAALRCRAKAASRPGISSIACRSRRSATARSCAAIVKEAAAEDERGRETHSRPRARATRACAIPIARKRRLQGRAEGASPAAPTSSRAGLPPIAPARIGPAQTLALHHLLERQHYRLGHWRLASSDINYRRFFDVNSLAGLRVEDAGTFDAVHRLVKKLIADGKLQGLRLDHIDGLRDPAQYFQRLRRLIREAQGKAAAAVLRGGREDPWRAREPAALRRRPRHHRL